MQNSHKGLNLALSGQKGDLDAKLESAVFQMLQSVSVMNIELSAFTGRICTFLLASPLKAFLLLPKIVSDRGMG